MKPEQITAWALDEASAEERERLEAELRDDPKAKQAADETKNFCHFLLAELRDESLAFTDEQREKLKAQPVNVKAQEGSLRAGQRTSWRTGVIVRLALAACVVLGGFWTWNIYDSRRMEGQVAAAQVTDESYRVRFDGNAVVERGQRGALVPLQKGELKREMGELAAYLESRKLPAAPAAKPAPSAAPGLPTLKAKQNMLTQADTAKIRQLQDEATYMLNGRVTNYSASGQAATGSGLPINGGALALNGGVAPASSTTAFSRGAGAIDALGVSGPADKTVAEVSESQSVVSQPDAYYFAAVKDKDSGGLVREGLLERETVPGLRRKSGAEGESYTRILENELKDVAREPLSTFSIDVDTASYANVRRFLNQGMIPPADAVRIEELVNYFPTAEEGPVPTAKEPFGVRVELAPCPWQPAHRLARIAIKGRELGNERKASNLVFLVDVSGSMNEPSKLPLVQQSLRMLTEQLGEGDKVTMVVYAGSSGLVLPPTNGEKKSEILAAIDKLQAGGSTHGSAGIQLAYEQAVAGFIKEGVNRVILCTDGDFNVGVSSPEELEKLITKKAKSGVSLSVLGFGTGNLKDRTMETLADKGNGNYAYIDSLSEARKVLVEQMSGTLVTIAKDVKIQVEFNPAAVRSYRLIGYENRLLAKEDFNDDTKDAGEIGAGHSVVALYEVVPANLPPGSEPRPAVDGLKYQTPAVAPAQLAEAAKSGEMMTVKLRYKAPDSDLSKLIEMPVKDEGKTLTASSEEYKFSAAVAGFGLLLRDSGYKGTLSWETVRKLAIDGKGADKLGYRGEFLQLIDKARGLKGQ